MAEKRNKSLREQIESETVASAEKGLAGRIEKTRTRKRSYVMNLRISSPSALGYFAIDGIDTAPALVRLARVKGLDVIAVTDFYSGAYIDRITEAARESSVTVIPGVVIRCAIEGCNDVVLSCLFPEDAGTADIDKFLRALRVPARAAGDAGWIVPLPFEEVLDLVRQHGAAALPSRMDKTPYRKAAILTLVAEYGFRAFDLAYFPESKSFFKEHWPRVKFQLFSFSNASALAQIGNRRSKVKMASPGFEGIRTITERAAAI